jgi:hypothetical protein
VAYRLIGSDSITYFLDNCRLIYESQTPLSVQQPLAYNNSNKESVIAAFDMVQDLVKGSKIRCFILRFTYIYSVEVIDTYKTLAANARV